MLHRSFLKDSSEGGACWGSNGQLQLYLPLFWAQSPSPQADNNVLASSQPSQAGAGAHGPKAFLVDFFVLWEIWDWNSCSVCTSLFEADQAESHLINYKQKSQT